MDRIFNCWSWLSLKEGYERTTGLVNGVFRAEHRVRGRRVYFGDTYILEGDSGIQWQAAHVGAVARVHLVSNTLGTGPQKVEKH